MKTEKKIRWRIGTISESIKYIKLVEPDYKRACRIKDGSSLAMRVMINKDTGEPVLNSKGWASVCAPWLLIDIFYI